MLNFVYFACDYQATGFIFEYLYPGEFNPEIKRTCLSLCYLIRHFKNSLTIDIRARNIELKNILNSSNPSTEKNVHPLIDEILH